MKRLLPFLLFLFLSATASAQMTKTNIVSAVNADFPSGCSQCITAALLRTVFIDVINSYWDFNGSGSFTCASNTWVSAGTTTQQTCTQPAFNNLSNYQQNEVSNLDLALTPAYTFKGNATSGSATPTDFTIGSLTQKVTPNSSDLLVISDQAASGATKYITLGSLPQSQSAAIGLGSTVVSGVTVNNELVGTGTDSGGSGTATGYQVGGGLAISGTVLNTPGGWVNKFRNGPFDVWQRGTSVTIGTSGNYGPDGWKVYFSGSSNVAIGQLAGPENGAYWVANLSGASSNTDIKIGQRIESYVAAPLAGSRVTVQFMYYQNTGSPVTPKVSTCYASAQDNFSTCTGDLAATSLTSCASATWCQEAYTFTASANAVNGYEVDFDCNSGFTAAQNCRFATADIRVTPGVATGINSNPPPPELRPIGVELAFSQRYYQTSYDNGVAAGTATHVGTVCAVGPNGTGTTNAAGCPFRVSMRADPLVSMWDGAGTAGRCSYYNGSAWTDNYNCGVSAASTGQNGFIPWVGSSGNTNPVVFWWAASAEL